MTRAQIVVSIGGSKLATSTAIVAMSKPRVFVRRKATVTARQIETASEAAAVAVHGHGDYPKVGDWIVEGAGRTWIVEQDAFAALYEELRTEPKTWPATLPWWRRWFLFERDSPRHVEADRNSTVK